MFSHFIYTAAPIFYQNVLISIRAYIRMKLRVNSKSSGLLNQLCLHDHSNITLDKYVATQLFTVLDNATSHAEFYGGMEVFNQNVTIFSFIDKSVLMAAADRFVSKIKLRLVVNGSTSGTTGAPLKIPQSMDSVVCEQAFISRHLKWAGFEQGDKRAWLRGDMIVPVEQKKAPYWRYSWFDNTILLSSFHMTQEALPLYIQAMVEYGVDVIQAYPSSIVTLAKYLEAKGEYYLGV